jgi:hypothetical protein
MISWGEYRRDPPYVVQTYCPCCHSAQTHYLNTQQTTVKKDCYECVRCHHLVFAPVLDAPDLDVVLPD